MTKDDSTEDAIALAIRVKISTQITFYISGGLSSIDVIDMVRSEVWEKLRWANNVDTLLYSGVINESSPNVFI